MKSKDDKRRSTVERELTALERKEQKMEAAVRGRPQAAWKKQLEEKVPKKVYATLEAGFSKGFSLVYCQGRGLIRRTYEQEALQTGYRIRDFAFCQTGRRKELKELYRDAERHNLQNMAMTTAEGIGLGLLGIGLPDIILFLGHLLKGMDELALSYGFSCTGSGEQLLMLKLMAAAMSDGEHWAERNEEVNRLLLQSEPEAAEEDISEQIRVTASAFATDMLLLKFVQGLPLVGVLGGAANPVCYHRVMRYAAFKYRKRYLLQMERREGHAEYDV